jgi:hypothetical protein
MRNALAGRVLNATQTRNGSQPGTFVGTGGLYVAERRLRLLLGLPLKDEAVIRPVSEPKIMPVDYQWQSLVHEAVSQRPELKKQRQILKSLELQKDASQEFKKPRLDAFGRYRFRGFGDRLIGRTDTTGTNLTQGAVEDLFGGQFQEWELGIEMTLPIGYRQGHAAVRNLEIQIARERALLHQQERQIVHDLSNALAELRRAEEVTEISYNRLISAQQRFSSLNEDTDSPDEILDAQVRLAEAKSNYFRSLVEHEAALRNIHYEKGTLLPFRNVILADQFSEENNSHWEISATNSNEFARVSSETAPSTDPQPESADPEIDPTVHELPEADSRSEELPGGNFPSVEPVDHQVEQNADEEVPLQQPPLLDEFPAESFPPEDPSDDRAEQGAVENASLPAKDRLPPPEPAPLGEAFGENSPPPAPPVLQADQTSVKDAPLPRPARVSEAFGENSQPADPPDHRAAQNSVRYPPLPSATISSVKSRDEPRKYDYGKEFQVQFVPRTEAYEPPQKSTQGDEWQTAE